MKSNKRTQTTVIRVLLTVGVLLIFASLLAQRCQSLPVSFPPFSTVTPEPLLPTPTQSVAVQVGAEVTATPMLTPMPTPTVAVEVLPAGALDDDAFGRIGIGGPLFDTAGPWDAGLRWTHHLDWRYTRHEEMPEELTYWRTLRMDEDGWRGLTWESVLEEAETYPGSIWIVGNEPDVKWQDGVSAEFYAEMYHDAYTRIKEVDPSAQLAIGAVTAGTELRMRYLDTVIATYQSLYDAPMPVDVWTVHAYVLREERDSWGVDIPPGMTEDSGDLFEIEDHDDLDLFVAQLVRMRQWMADNGYRDLPLAVTEFGILLPNDYGFPEASIAQYMRDTYDIMYELTDPQIGYPGDENRLVQVAFWFAMTDLQYSTSALWDADAEQLTTLGETLRAYVGR